jgi:tetratricopeptide (TPR) repeat protein
MAIEGPLAELGIGDVLQLLGLTRKTGVLSIRADRLSDEAIVHFSRGAIVFAVRRRSTRRLGQLLIRAGQLTQRELDRALEIQHSEPTRRLAEILLEMGSVGEEELERQLRFQMEENIYELMAWTDGYFKFEERVEIAEQRLLARVRVDSLLMEGSRRIDEWSRLEARVPGPEAVPALSPNADRDATPLELRPDEWEVLAELDGERDVRQLAADLGRSEFDVGKVVYGLVSTGLVSIAERRARLSEQQLRTAREQVEALLASGNSGEAQKLAAELEGSYPDRVELAILAGRALLAQGRMRAAAEAFGRAVALDPLSSEAHYRLGFAAVRTGELERAARAWDRFVVLTQSGESRQLVRSALDAVRTLSQVLEKAVH